MKRLKEVYILFLFLFTSLLGFGQNGYYQPKLWKLMNMDGNIELYGQYNELYRANLMNENKETNYLYSGRIELNTKSYFWHPNFLVLDLKGEYNPGAGQETSILAPDYAIVNSAKRLNVMATFFRQKKVSFKTFIDYNDAYTNLENLSIVNLNFFNWGGSVSYLDKWLPLTINYKNATNESEEKYTNRIYKNKEETIVGIIKNSIGKRDQNEFKFSQRNYAHELLNVYENVNYTTNLTLKNDIFIDKNSNYRFSSNIFKLYQTGTNPYDRLSINENLHLNLPRNFRFNTSFRYLESHQNELYLKNKNFRTELNHKWYESLKTAVYFTKFNNTSGEVNDSQDRVGFNIAYQKKNSFKRASVTQL